MLELLLRFQDMDRRWIFLGMAIAIVVPMLLPFSMPFKVDKRVQDLYDEVEKLEPGDAVFISADFDPGSRPELEPFFRTHLHHLFRKDVRVVMGTLWATAPPLVKPILEEIAGARMALDQLTLPRCICSNSSSQRLELELEHVGLWDYFFPHVFSAPEVGTQKVKPAPDVFVHACEQFGVAPQAAIVIEDSVHGVTAAVAAGCRVVGFTGAGHSFPGHADALTEAGAETVISRLADFPAVVDAFVSWQDA